MNEKPDYDAIQKSIKKQDIQDADIRNIDGSLNLEAIKKLLADAAPGPWRKDPPDRWGVIGGISSTVAPHYEVIQGTDDAFGIYWENANLIALAPTIIKELVEKIEQLEKDLKNFESLK